MPHSSRSSGFTLIEVGITFTILVIIGLIGSLTLFGVRQSEMLESETKQLTSLLQNAQNKSAGQDSDSRWGVFIKNPSSGAATYALYQINETAFSACDPNCTDAPGSIVQQVALPSLLNMTTPARGNNLNLYFSRISGLPNTSTTVTLQANNSEESLRVDVSRNGRIEYR